MATQLKASQFFFNLKFVCNIILLLPTVLVSADSTTTTSSLLDFPVTLSTANCSFQPDTLIKLPDELLRSGLNRDYFVSRTSAVNCSSSRRQSAFNLLTRYMCTPLVTPLYSLEPYLEQLTKINSGNGGNGSEFDYAYILDDIQAGTDLGQVALLAEKIDQLESANFLDCYDFSKADCCNFLAATDCQAVIGNLLSCTVAHSEELISVDRLGLISNHVYPFFANKHRQQLVTEEGMIQAYQCANYSQLSHCTTPVSLTVMLAVIGLSVLATVVCTASCCVKCCRKKEEDDNRNDAGMLEWGRQSSIDSSKGVVGNNEEY